MAKVILVEDEKKPSLVIAGPGADSGSPVYHILLAIFGYRALAAIAITETWKFETNELELTNPLLSQILKNLNSILL